MLNQDERKILSSAVTHGTEAGWCPALRVPQAPTPVQAEYLLNALRPFLKTLPHRLERMGYSAKRCDRLVEMVSALEQKLEAAL